MVFKKYLKDFKTDKKKLHQQNLNSSFQFNSKVAGHDN